MCGRYAQHAERTYAALKEAIWRTRMSTIRIKINTSDFQVGIGSNGLFVIRTRLLQRENRIESEVQFGIPLRKIKGAMDIQVLSNQFFVAHPSTRIILPTDYSEREPRSLRLSWPVIDGEIIDRFADPSLSELQNSCPHSNGTQFPVIHSFRKQDLKCSLRFSPKKSRSVKRMSSRAEDKSRDSKKTRGRPPKYVWNENDELSDEQKKHKAIVEKRRVRQKRSYDRKKQIKEQEKTLGVSYPSSDSIYDDDLRELSKSLSSDKKKSGKKSGSDGKPGRSSDPLVLVRDYPHYP